MASTRGITILGYLLLAISAVFILIGGWYAILHLVIVAPTRLITREISPEEMVVWLYGLTLLSLCATGGLLLLRWNAAVRSAYISLSLLYFSLGIWLATGDWALTRLMNWGSMLPQLQFGDKILVRGDLPTPYRIHPGIWLMELAVLTLLTMGTVFLMRGYFGREHIRKALGIKDKRKISLSTIRAFRLRRQG